MRYTGPQIPFYVLSAERSTLSPDANGLRTKRLHQALLDSGLPFRPAMGSYKGVTEVSFLVFDSTREHGDAIKDLAKQFEQESVPYVDGARMARLIEADMPGVTIGKWRELEENDARRYPAWTSVGSRYFVAD